MGRTCAAVNCKSGYKGHQKIPIFSFPCKKKDPLRHQKWVRFVSRKDFELSANIGLCLNHFSATDILRTKQDSNKWRKGSTSSDKVRLGLANTAEPQIQAQGVPEGLNRRHPTPRKSSKATAESRRAPVRSEKVELTESIQLFDDEISCLEDLLTRLEANSATLPGGFLLKRCDDHVLLLYVIPNLDTKVPAVAASITVNSGLCWTVAISGRPVPRSACLTGILGASFTHFTQVTYLMAAVKGRLEAPDDLPWLETAILCLESFLEREEENEEEDGALKRKVQFLLEQLQLAMKKPKGRRYSSGLLVFSYLLNAKSSSAYRELQVSR